MQLARPFRVKLMPDSEPGESPRFCDLVMKGGIASGVVYPRAIWRLSKTYHFHSIGGSSVGAIAAVIAAAAEYRRRCGRGDAGFELLGALPDYLGRRDSDEDRSRLFKLFQPQSGTRRLFNVLALALNRRSAWQRGLKIAQAMVTAYWPVVLVAVVAGITVLRLSGSVLASASVTTISLVAGMVGWLLADLLRGVVPNGFGLCTGMSERDDVEALTPWLHRTVQEAAGRQVDDDPLTFKDLWQAEGSPLKSTGLSSDNSNRSIDLQTFSTNLSHGRPYVFPLAVDDDGENGEFGRERLYYDPVELARLIPAGVVIWMNGRSAQCPLDTHAHLRLLPTAGDLPVLMAARMSLAFPLLLSAVPLYAHDTGSGSAEPSIRRCWFADGGISSNFPVHLFDSLLPSWPTFAINLERETPSSQPVYLPTRYDEGYDERWNRFADQRTAFGRLLGFGLAIVSAMQNWNDNSLARMPGVRDRVVRVALPEGQGGLNLDMDLSTMTRLASLGEWAAEQLITRFAPSDARSGKVGGWDEHRFIRLSVLLRMLEARAPGLIEGLALDLPHATKLNDLIMRYESDGRSDPVQGPPGYVAAMSTAQRDALLQAIAALDALASSLEQPGTPSGFRPVPEPVLRVRPPL